MAAASDTLTKCEYDSAMKAHRNANRAKHDWRGQPSPWAGRTPAATCRTTDDGHRQIGTQTEWDATLFGNWGFIVQEAGENAKVKGESRPTRWSDGTDEKDDESEHLAVELEEPKGTAKEKQAVQNDRIRRRTSISPRRWRCTRTRPA